MKFLEMLIKYTISLSDSAYISSYFSQDLEALFLYSLGIRKVAKNNSQGWELVAIKLN